MPEIAGSANVPFVAMHGSAIVDGMSQSIVEWLFMTRLWKAEP